MEKIKHILLSNPKGYIISLILGCIMFLLCLLVKGNYLLIGFIDASGFTFLFLFFFSLLLLVNHLGAFDTFKYGTYYVFKHNSQKYDSLSTYHEEKNKVRKNKFPYIPYMIVSIFFLIIYYVLNMFLY